MAAAFGSAHGIVGKMITVMITVTVRDTPKGNHPNGCFPFDSGDEARIPPILYWVPSISPTRADGGPKARCLPNAIAPASVYLRGGVTADRPGFLGPAFTHHRSG